MAIGIGTPDQARAFVKKFNFQGKMYVNPGLSVYKAFGLMRGIWKTVGPASAWRAIRAMLRGNRQGSTAGDLWQQGGMFVLGPGRQLLFEHRNPAAGKQVDLKAVVEAAKN